MKKILLIWVLFTSIQNYAASPFEVNKNYLSIGFGSGYYYYGYYKAYRAYPGYMVRPSGTLALSYERGIKENIGLGVSVNRSSGYAYWKSAGNGNQKYYYRVNYYSFELLVKAYYHFKTKEAKLDPFVSAGIGFRNYGRRLSSDDPGWDYHDASFNPLGICATAGLRYYFTDKVAGFLEAGAGTLALAIGATIKF